MNRRIFLRGLGGAVVAAPFLASISGRGARAQPVAPQQRLIVMFTPLGCITNRFFPTQSHGPLTAADLQSTTLKHLAPFVDKLLIPRGIRAMNEWTSGLLRGQGNDSHRQVLGSYFTCQPIAPNSDDPTGIGAYAELQERPIGPSLDHVITQALNPAVKPLFLRPGAGIQTETAISWSAAAMSYPALTLKQAYGNLTGLFKDGAPLSPDSYQAARGKSIIDLVRADLDSLERYDMSQADKRKLDAWKDLLDQTGSAVAAQCAGALATKLGLTQANIDGASATAHPEFDPLTHAVTDSLDIADIHSNLVVLAALCNVSPVSVLSYPHDFVFKGLGLNFDLSNHSLSHRIGDYSFSGTCLSGVIDAIATIDDYYARKFAYLVGQLASIEEGDGKVLDNTAAVWFQEMSDGAAHNLNNLPIVQAGSAGGYFKTGWTVNVEDGSPHLSAGNSEAACQSGPPELLDLLAQSTGTDPSVANAPINKYFCNLMNALGVKAGADGFAALDGTAEVTHFGRYDKTEDFIHGQVNPPKIWDPGEFAALKANS